MLARQIMIVRMRQLWFFGNFQVLFYTISCNICGNISAGWGRGGIGHLFRVPDSPATAGIYVSKSWESEFVHQESPSDLAAVRRKRTVSEFNENCRDVFQQCSGSVAFWFGSGYADPYQRIAGIRILFFSSVAFSMPTKIIFFVKFLDCYLFVGA